VKPRERSTRMPLQSGIVVAEKDVNLT